MEGKSQRSSLALNSGRTGVSLKRWLRRRRLSCLRYCICEYYCRWPQVCSCCCHSFSYIRVFYFLHWSTTLVHLSLLCEVPHSHSDTHHSVGLLCTNDRPDVETTWIQECPICYLFIINFTRYRLLKLPPGCRYGPNLLISYVANVGCFYQRFGKLYRSHLKGSSVFLDYQHTLRVAAPSIPNEFRICITV